MRVLMFFFSSRRRHTRFDCDWSSDVCSSGRDEARERLLEHLILAKPEQLGNRIVRLQDLAFEVGDEHGVRGVGDDDVGIQRTVRFEVPAVTFDRGRLRTEFLPSSHSKPPSRPPAPYQSNWDSKGPSKRVPSPPLSTLK